MGVSFKVAKIGSRYKPRLLQIEDEDDQNGSVECGQQRVNEGNVSGVGDKVFDISNVLAKPRQHSASDEIEASFSLNLFPNGFSVGRVSESFNNAPEQLYPYNRASETLFSAIEYGWLPGDAFDDLPFKYFNGSVLCEVQDYRNCLFHEGGISFTQNSPIVHKVILQMCMENVVRDILSISDDSWTYMDLLEVESHILKALQPNLCLNPQPLLSKRYREPPAKKVNLKISWSRKKGEQHNASAANQVFRNLCHNTAMPERPDNSASQNSNFLCGIVNQARGVMCPTSVLDQEHSILREMNSHSYPFTPQPNCHLAETRDLSVSAELTTSNVCLSKRSSSKRTRDLANPSSSNLCVEVRCQKQAIQGPLLKKPKKEPVDCFYEQFPGKTIEVSSPQLQWQNTVLHQQTEAERAFPERFQDKMCPLQLIKIGLPANHGGILNSQAGAATSIVKLEPADTCFPSLDIRNIKDNYFVKDRRVNPSDGIQSTDQQSSPLLKVNCPRLNTLLNPIKLPIDKCLRTGNVSGKRKCLENPQSMYDGSAPASSRTVDLLPTEASAPSMGKATPLKGFGINSTVKITSANSPLEMNNLSSQPSEIEGVSLQERLLKIAEVTQRFRLINKRKVDETFIRRQVFHTSTLVALYLSNCEDIRNLENTTMDKVSLSKSLMGRSNVPSARTLKFVHKQSPVYQENEVLVADKEVQVRLILVQKSKAGMVVANVLYGSEDETNSAVLSLLPIFHSAHSADLFTSEFTWLMTREGYHLVSDQVEPMFLNTEGNSSSQEQPSSTVNQSAGTLELSSSTSTPVLSHCILSPSGNMSSYNFGRLPSQETFPGTQLLPAGNVRSSLQLTNISSPKLQPDIAAPFSSVPLAMQEIISRHAHLEHQMQQRRMREQEQHMQKRTMLGGLGVTGPRSGMLQLSGRNGILGGVGNCGLGSFGNFAGNMTLGPKIIEGCMPSTGNVTQQNNFCSNTFGLNDSKQLLGSTNSDFLAFVSSRLTVAEGQWGRLGNGAPIQRNDLLMSMNRPNVPEVPCTLSTLQQSQVQIYQQEMQWSQPRMLLLQQQMRSPLQNLESINLSNQIGSSRSQLSPQHFVQQAQINRRQQPSNRGSILEEINNRNVVGSRRRAESSGGWKMMHGAMFGSKKNIKSNTVN